MITGWRPPTALEILSDATPQERELLGVFRYMPMDATLHTDLSVFPRTAVPHSGFSMTVSCTNQDVHFSGFNIDASVIQRIATPKPLICSYNGTDKVAPEHFLAQSSYEHPVFNSEVFAVQPRLPSLNTDRLAFAGSYFGSGYHEDGCASGVAAAAALGATWE
ncbi:hypothetical protein ACFYW6_37355 [Streptomyces sp. NPDC002659]|uniref:hypothetical protein n=1 Tax=Streptomyces sp. NPDC002659 TaxID=3364656 RepID=UPI0036AD8C0C